MITPDNVLEGRLSDVADQSVLDNSVNMNWIRDRILPAISRSVSWTGTRPELQPQFMMEASSAVDKQLRAIATRRKISIKGFPSTALFSPKERGMSHAIAAWKASHPFRSGFFVDVRQDLSHPERIRVTGRTTHAGALIPALLAGLVLEIIFWPPPNIFRPWHPLWIAGSYIFGVVVFVYMLLLFGWTQIRAAAVAAAACVVGLYLFWPLWLGFFSTYAISLWRISAVSGPPLRAELTAAFEAADAVEARYAIKRAAVAEPGGEGAPAKPPSPSFPCPICGIPLSSRSRGCASCGFTP